MSLPLPARIRALVAPPGGPPRSLGRKATDTVVYGGLALLAAFGVVVAVWGGRHAFAIHRLTRGPGDTVFLDRDDRPWFRLDEHRRDVPLARISPHVRRAFVAVEDRRFYKHPGIDPVGLARAVAVNLKEGRLGQGGSTLTQQLARTLYLSNARTWGRKAKEALLAVLLEQQLTKDQILELYLNRIYLGSGLYGVEAMSLTLFGRPARDLGLAEAALLAGLAKAPGSLSPWSNYEGARSRSHVVLAAMRDQGYIGSEDERRARQARVRIVPERVVDDRGGYAKDYLRQLFRDRFGGDNPPEWSVHTTFSPALQQAAEDAVRVGLRRLGVPGLQAALVALDPETGDVFALVGGRDYSDSPFNRAARSRRQPGSAFKPFVYAAALDRGFSPVSVLSHLRSVHVPGKEEWAPRNSGGEEPDELTLRQALLESDNRAAAALQMRVGSRAVLGLAADLGLKDLPDVPSLALGSGLVTPLDLGAAYAAFPNGGHAVRPRGVRMVVDASGNLALDPAVERRRVLKPEVAYQALSMMRDVVDVGTGAAVRSLGVGFPVAGKTGTTDDFRDAWFAGFSTGLVAVVWVGFDQPATIARDAYGARVALPIWADFMRRAARVVRPGRFEPPPGLELHDLCRVSYLRPLEDCPTYTEVFKRGDGVPSRLCALHRGSLQERVQRGVEGILDSLEKRIRDIFR